nr:LuxR C-terminal-related transcriptional regulator [Actinomycetota bacterium]
RGLPNRRIAEELHISEATVKRHMANIFERVGANSRSEAVMTALVEQWIGVHEITHADGSDGHDSPDGSGG